MRSNINVNYQLCTETEIILDTVLHQNYFQYYNNFFQPTKGIAMVSSISSIILKTFLQEYEQILIRRILESKRIAYSTRYVDDIFVIYHNYKITRIKIENGFNNHHMALPNS
jgi:hypothetical protein